MKRTQKNVALILTLLLFLLCATMGIVGLTRQTKVSLAEGEYVSPLPDGAYLDDVTVLDVNAGALSGSAIKHRQEMGEANAVRMKVTATAGNTWNTYFGLFVSDTYYKGPDGEANFYVSFRQAQNADKTRTIDLHVNIGSGYANTIGKALNFNFPDWLNLSTAGASYDFELGAIRAFNASGVAIGSLIYMDVDNVRLVEYYFNSDHDFSGSNFHYEANQTAGSLTTYDEVIVASSATVTFSRSEYSKGEKPAPRVTLVTEKSGVSYGRTLAPSDYDIAYADNDKSGTATATLTFKGRYTGTATATFNVVDIIGDAVASYESKLPDGAYLEDYTVLDVAKEYGTNGVYTTTMSGDKGFALALNGASAYTFKFSQTKSPWSVRFGIFNNENGYLQPDNASACVDLRSVLLDVLPNETVYNKNFTMPAGITYSMANVYEFGGIRVFNESGEQIGRLFYLEINGLRVLEYFFHYEGTDLFTNDYLTIHNVLSASAGESVVTLTSPEVEDLTGNVGIKFGKSVVTDGKATPEISVISGKSFGGTVYAQEIEKQYYDLVYANNGAQGTATVSVTFKGKYSGAVSSSFDVVGISLTSDTDQAQTVFAMKDADVTLGAIAVENRAFIGYEVGGKLSATATVNAVSGATAKFVTVDFTTLDKASVRMYGTTGMRFLSSISSEDKAKLENYGAVKFGTLITSPDREGYLKIETQNWVANGELKVDGRDSFTAVITNFEGVGEASYTTRYTARAYVEITVDGGETVLAYAFVASDFSRTYAELCHVAIQAEEITAENPNFEYFTQVASYHVAQ